MSTEVDPDAVYQKAVKKLRLLLSASEAASSLTDTSQDEDNMMEHGFTPLGKQTGSFNDVHFRTLTDPPIKPKRNRYVKNSGVKRALFGKERTNSWHNLVHLDDESNPHQGGGDELSLIRKQEHYIRQLEKESTFCREQLAIVLQNVKDILHEQTAVPRAAEVNQALSNVFGTIQTWESNANVNQTMEVIRSLRQENERLKENQTKGTAVEKIRKDNTLLSQALNRLRTDLEDVKRTEAEAVEQVKRSVQVAEQLRMEKSELEFEINQGKMQVERQQAKIRALIEEQVSKIDEERALIERRCQDQVRQIRDESNHHLEEIGRLSSAVDHGQRVESELRREIQERDKIIKELNEETEKKLAKMQLEHVRINSARKEFEQENNNLKIDLDHAQHELKSSTTRLSLELNSLKNRLAKSEEMLMSSRQEALELAEEKAALQREIGIVKQQFADKHAIETSRKQVPEIKTSELSQEMTVIKLQDMVKRQSQIIGDLKHQCNLVTDKLEMTVKEYEQVKEKVLRENRALKSKTTLWDSEKRQMEARLEERGGLHERLCRRLEDLDLSHGKLSRQLRQSHLNCETLKQEKSSLEHQVEFYKDVLKARGLLPERDKDQDEEIVKKAKKQAIVVERNGRISSPFLKSSK